MHSKNMQNVKKEALYVGRSEKGPNKMPYCMGLFLDDILDDLDLFCPIRICISISRDQ